MILGAGVAAYAAARSGLLPRAWVFGAGIWIASGTGLLFAGCGIGQHLSGAQAVSTEGNRNYAGATAAILVPAALAFSLVRAPLWKRALAGAAAGALLVHLHLADSRAGFAGAAVGALVAWGALRARRVPVGGVAAALGLLLLAGAPALRAKRDASEERLKTAGVRLEIWKGALRLFADRPWLGAGAGNFAVEFPPYRSEAEFRYHQEQAGTDFKEVEDPHSSWVQVAVETGLPGIAAALLVLSLAARRWIRYVRAAPDPDYVAVLAGLGGGAAAFLAAGLFNTLAAHASHTVLFWSFLGLIELAGNPREHEERRRVGFLAVALPGGAAIALAVAAVGASSLSYAEWSFAKAMTSPPTSGARGILLAKALSGNPASWRAHYEQARVCDSEGRLEEAILEARQALSMRPYHLPTLNNLAVYLLRQGPGKEGEAGDLLREAVRAGPYYYLSRFNLGSFLLVRRSAEARGQFEEAARLNPRHAPSHFSLGETYLLAGDPAGALPHFRRAAALGLPVGRDLRAAHPQAAGNPLLAEFFR
jgi:O-antigen ligase